MDAIAIQKKALRTRAKATRAAAHARQGPTAGAALAAHGLGFAGASSRTDVSAFLAIGEEIDPMPLMRRLWAEGHRVGLPVMVGKGQPLVFRQWREGQPLAEVQWGIREPLPTAPQLVPDVMLVPLLAFDAKGYRLGYGGGFYDRTLEKLAAGGNVLAVGVAYAAQEVPAVPRGPHDRRLDWIITERAARRVA